MPRYISAPTVMVPDEKALTGMVSSGVRSGMGRLQFQPAILQVRYAVHRTAMLSQLDTGAENFVQDIAGRNEILCRIA
jgi:hypothetical protein